MKKKLLSLLMAVAMIATLAVPAFAAEDPVVTLTEGKLTYAGAPEIPPVTVKVRGSVSMTLNPYGMSLASTTISGGSIVSGDSTDQIVVPALYIENKTMAPMKFGVKATATVASPSKVVLSAKPCTGKETTPNAFVMAEFYQQDNLDAPPTWVADWSTTAKTNETINEKFYPQIIPTADGKNAPALYSIDRATMSGGVVTAPNYLIANVTGNLAGNPTDGWTDTDTLTLTLEFTFTPGVANEVDITGTGVALYDVGHESSYVTGATVRLTGPVDKTPVVKDANDTAVTVNKGPKDGYYYFVMPATSVTVTPGA